MMFRPVSEAPQSVIHRLHPFVKMGAGAGCTALALMMTDPRSLGMLLLLFLLVLGIARVSVSFRQALSILLFMGTVAGLNFWASGDPNQALAYGLRLAVFIVAMPAMALTTAPQEMSRALSRLPLPPGLVVALLLVWRFFPKMAEDAREMRLAARLRGRTVGGPAARIYRGFLVPMAFCVVGYADQVTLALELRGFSPAADRTCRRPPRFHGRDAAFLALVLLFAGAAGWVQWSGALP